MEHVSLYRRFRPNTFDNVIGQGHITRTLINQIRSGNVGHAYLFTGTRGTGKTSCAKIFARAINCLTPVNGSPCGQCEVCKTLENQNNVDILEIDAASNNGVEEIRALRENVYYRPTVGKYKVYIVDEVHMLTTSAFNALLKTLEEPPAHVVFILATTEVHKIPQTILSRCLRFDFRLVEEEELVALLKKIFGELGIGYEETALHRIAVSGEGSVRDTLSIADMCMSYCGDTITTEGVLDILGATDFSELDVLCGAILDGDCAKALSVLDKLLKRGRTTVYKDMAQYFSDLISVKNVPDFKPGSVSENELALLKNRTEHSNYRISRLMDIMAELENKIRFSTQPRILLEAAVVRGCELVTELNLDGLTNRVTELEEKLKKVMANGVPVQAVPAPPPPQEKPAPKKPAVDVSKLLSQVGTEETGAKQIFDEEATTNIDQNAAEVWSRMVTKLSEMHEMALYMATSGIKEKSVRISGKDFIVTTNDHATLELIGRENNKRIVQSVLSEELGTECNLVFRTPKPKNALSEEDKLTLNKLFDGSIKFKN